jgi:hypothetical protein
MTDRPVITQMPETLTGVHKNYDPIVACTNVALIARKGDAVLIDVSNTREDYLMRLRDIITEELWSSPHELVHPYS